MLELWGLRSKQYSVAGRRVRKSVVLFTSGSFSTSPASFLETSPTEPQGVRIMPHTSAHGSRSYKFVHFISNPPFLSPSTNITPASYTLLIDILASL